MTTAYLYIFGSVIVVSIISIIGIVALAINEQVLKKILFFLVSFAAGGLLGDVFFHIFPESLESEKFSSKAGIFVLVGIILFFILEKLIHWRHCHIYHKEAHEVAPPDRHEHPHTHSHHLAFMNIMGDGLHNFIDGLIIAGSYLISIPLGITTTIAVILHEIPQEMGDFGVLVHSGLTRMRALMWNFVTALTAVIGAVAGIFLGGSPEFTEFLLPFTAGGFLYIAMSDLIPELHKEFRPWKSVMELLGLALGIFVMYGLTFLE